MNKIQIISLIGLAFGLAFFFGTMLYLHHINKKPSNKNTD